MKITLISIGKQHDDFLAQAITNFTKRLNNYFTVNWLLVASPKNAASLAIADLKKEEAKILLSKLSKEDVVVLLDEEGKQLSSIDLANYLQQQANTSIKKIVFIIGGAFGVDVSIKQRANLVWSLSKLVFPHMLVRVILAEQLYRACTILKNEKYHHL